jgi:carboxyl-terminal processing protease
MRLLTRVARVVFFLGALALASLFAAKLGPGGLWRGFDPALATTGQPSRAPYDLTRLEAVNETLKMVRKKYVDPDRVKPKQMLLSALNYVQRDVAQVLVHQDDADEVVVRVGAESRTFRVDNVQGPWDVAARLREVFAFLQKNLAGEDVDLRALEYAACNGMLHTLDPHSVFLTPEAFKEMNVQTSGAFGGLGIVISVRDQMLTVMRPMPNTPAQRAGLKRMDRIVKIENESTLNMPLDDAVRRLRGEPGSSVTVWVLREGDDGFGTPRAIQLKREVIKVASVDSRMLDGGVGYMRLKNFQATTLDEVEGALEAFSSKGAMRGLVLDLRGNPGGLLDQAVKVADKFLASGVIVATQGSSEGRDERKARPQGTEPDYPIVVLVDGSSASASEILAGALKNHRRALVVGEQSFGKGSVQLVFSDVTPEKAALKLTIAQYLTPGDVSIQGVGITPDIELDPDDRRSPRDGPHRPARRPPREGAVRVARQRTRRSGRPARGGRALPVHLGRA